MSILRLYDSFNDHLHFDNYCVSAMVRAELGVFSACLRGEGLALHLLCV